MFIPGVYFSTSTGYIARWDADGGLDINSSSDVFITDIAFHPDGRLFAIDSTSLYEVEQGTGVPELIGDLSGSLYYGHVRTDGANGFDIGSDGTALISSANNSVIAQVDLSSGALTNVGLLGAGVYSAGDLLIDESSGFARVIISTTVGNLSILGRTIDDTGQLTGQYGRIGSDFIGSSEIYGLAGPIRGTTGPIGFDGTTVYDLGAAGGVYGTEIGSFTVPNGYITGAATLRPDWSPMNLDNSEWEISGVDDAGTIWTGDIFLENPIKYNDYFEVSGYFNWVDEAIGRSAQEIFKAEIDDFGNFQTISTWYQVEVPGFVTGTYSGNFSYDAQSFSGSWGGGIGIPGEFSAIRVNSAEEGGPSDPDNSPADDDPSTGPIYAPTTLDLEYAARVVAYERVPENEYVLPGGYQVDTIDTESGFHAVALTADLAEPILTIRGTVTDTALDIITNLDRDGVGVGQVDDAWPEIAGWLEDNPGAHVTGHSLGGAQSQLVAVEAARAGLPLASVTTFNAPGISRQRLGDTALDDATDVRHFVASGDLVSKAGLAFLPGDLRIYNFDSIDNFGFVNLPNPFSQIGNSHTGHWAQGEIQPGWFSDYDGNEIRPVAQTMSTEDLERDGFSYLYSGGNFDAEYFALLKGINLLPIPLSSQLAYAGATRAGVEGTRDLFGIVAEVLRGELTLGEAALEAVRSAYTTARDWTIDVARTLSDWGQDVWTGISRWGAETWEQAVDLGVGVWESVTEWGQQTFDNIVTYGLQIAQTALEKIDDLQTAAADGISSAAAAVTAGSRSLWNFFTSDPDAEIVYADTGGNATHANSTSPAALLGGDGDGTLSSSAGSSLFASGSGATRHEMTDGGNVVWGLPSDLDGDSTLGFGTTDRFSYIETAFVSDMLLRDPGSAILSIDTNGDGETDVTIRLEGDYDLDAFTAIPDVNGTAVFYGEIPAEEVVGVSGAITDKSGNALTGALVHFERDFGELLVSESTEGGEFGFDVLRDAAGRVDATREFSTDDASITASDALDVLRLAVGLEPSWGPAEAQDFIAADINRDGQVTAQDALDVLRHAVGLESEYAPEWVFLDAEAYLGDIDRENVAYDTGVDFTVTDAAHELTMTGILTGSMQEYA